ncbi:MAG: N-acetyltransferase [Leptospiraceae bacterium]|nr:MAG: N-acetyltransferase [Leptospiraceae bacterium]
MNYDITHQKTITKEQLFELFKNSGIRRPYNDLNRIQKMIDHANLIITVWDNEKLVGIARCLTDFVYCCYLSDLAVDKKYQKKGIGKSILDYLKTLLTEEVSIILISAPEAMEFYPKMGFTKTDRAFLIQRKK